MKAAVLVNSEVFLAGPSRNCPDEATLRDLFRDRGIDADVQPVAPVRLAEAVAAAATTGVDAVIVGGGDGSISTAAGVLAGGTTPLGILPLGTLNHFAKDLGLPLEVEVAVGAIADGHVREVDVGEVNGTVFINNSSIGLYPRAVEERDAQRRRGWSKWPAMVYAMLRVISRFRVLRIRVRTDNTPRELTTPLVFVGNNIYEMRLLSIGARTALDRGELCLYVARTTGRLGLLRLGLHAVIGRLDQAREFESLRTTELEIQASRPTLRVARDGEVSRMLPPLRYRVRPRDLKVIAPPPAA